MLVSQCLLLTVVGQSGAQPFAGAGHAEPAPSSGGHGRADVHPESVLPDGAPGASCSSEVQCAGGNGKAAQIIHAAASLAALADGGLAQIPGAGAFFVVPAIQSGMVFALGHLYGCHLDLSHALALVTYFASDHVKKSVVKEIFGFIPIAGSLIKTSVTFFMTEGIGRVADRMLRCSTADDEVAKILENASDTSDMYNTDSMRRIFHVVTDFLVDANLSSMTAEDVWSRTKQLFSVQRQADLLADIDKIDEAGELLRVVDRHRWNLEVVVAALRALEERFPHPEACVAVDVVARTFWVPLAANTEAQAVTTPYLLRCTAAAEPRTRCALARAAARILAGARGRAHRGVSAELLRQAMEVLEMTAEEMEPAGPHGHEAPDPAAHEVGGDGLDAAQMVPALDSDRLQSVLTAVLAALQRGEGRACGALRALLRADARNAAAARSAARPSPVSWASIQHVKLLDSLNVPVGAELCVPALRADLLGQLTLATMPWTAELPAAKKRCAAGSRSRGGAECYSGHSSSAQLVDEFDSIVGQRCVIDRLAVKPGLVRLKQKGLWRPDMPLVLLLTGPSGTGKTMLARRLAEVLLGQPVSALEATGRFKTFHMNLFSLLEDQKSFFGPPRGIQGTGDLPELVKKWPDAVVLLDEIEKAHPSFARALLKLFGENGAVYDPHTGRDYETANVTFVLTSNLGKDLITHHAIAGASEQPPDEAAGAAEPSGCAAYGDIHKTMQAALREPRIGNQENFFRESELRGRLTDVLPFLPFRAQHVELAVRQFLAQEADTFSKSPAFKNIALAWDPSVVPLFAAEYARRPEEGLRGVHVQMQATVREIIESAIDIGLVRPFGGVMLRADPHGSDVTGGTLDLRFIPPGELPGRAAGEPAADSGAGAPGEGAPGGGAHAGYRRITDALADIGGGGWEWAAVREWQYLPEWNWELAWQQLWEFLWEWRLPVLLFAVMVFASTAATFMPPLVPATAAMVSGGTPAAIAAGSVAASWVPSVVAMVQLAVGAGSTAVPLLTAAYAWKNRHEIAALVWATVAVLSIPLVLRSTYARWIHHGQINGGCATRDSGLRSRPYASSGLRRRRPRVSHRGSGHAARRADAGKGAADSPSARDCDMAACSDGEQSRANDGSSPPDTRGPSSPAAPAMSAADTAAGQAGEHAHPPDSPGEGKGPAERVPSREAWEDEDGS